MNKILYYVGRIFVGVFDKLYRNDEYSDDKNYTNKSKVSVLGYSIFPAAAVGFAISGLIFSIIFKVDNVAVILSGAVIFGVICLFPAYLAVFTYLKEVTNVLIVICHFAQILLMKKLLQKILLDESYN